MQNTSHVKCFPSTFSSPKTDLRVGVLGINLCVCDLKLDSKSSIRVFPGIHALTFAVQIFFPDKQHPYQGFLQYLSHLTYLI
jgi:hypothetical protein